MAKTTLPDDIIVDILLRLPVKSLIRFSCVSKWWRSLVISDPEFAQSHFKLASKHKTLNHKLLFSTSSQLGSLDLEALSFQDNSSVSKYTCPFKVDYGTKILGSCNGLVCLAVFGFHRNFFIWNPSTGLCKKLSERGFSDSWSEIMLRLSSLYNGFGYVSATDDYKVVVALNLCVKVEVDIFSLRANVWKRVQAPDDQFQPMQSHHGVLLNEALHWLSEPQRDTEQAIFTFDLAKEEFRKVPLPVISEFDDMYFQHVGLLGGCLCVSRCKSDVCESIDFWVMTEYGVPESWTNLFRLKIFDHPQPISSWTFKPVFVTENGTVVASKCSSTDMELIRIGEKEEKLDDKNDKVVVWDGRYTVYGCHQICDLIEYDETLLWVNDYGGLEQQGKRLKTQHVQGIYR